MPNINNTATEPHLNKGADCAETDMIEGLSELRSVISAWCDYNKDYQRFLDGATEEPPKTPNKTVCEAEVEYPAAAVYYEAKCMASSDHAFMVWVGEQGMKAIVNSTEPEEVKKTMNDALRAFSNSVAHGDSIASHLLELKDVVSPNPVWILLKKPVTGFESGWAFVTGSSEGLNWGTHDDWENYPTVTAAFGAELDTLELNISEYGDTWVALTSPWYTHIN